LTRLAATMGTSTSLPSRLRNGTVDMVLPSLLIYASAILAVLSILCERDILCLLGAIHPTLALATPITGADGAATTVGSQTQWRIAVLLPASLQNSHQNGGAVFLIFVADPITVRFYPMSNTFSVPTQSSKPRRCWDFVAPLRSTLAGLSSVSR
jgi:hypothetical protein